MVWQYAAGADDVTAAYCLYLHHLSLAETIEAHLWHAQADPDRTRRLWPSLDHDGNDTSWGPALHAIVQGRAAAPATDAVVGYVSQAMQYVDDLDLPLPPAEFAEHIKELASTT